MCVIDKAGNCRSESRWKRTYRALENGADLCVSEGQALSEYRVSFAEEEVDF